MRQAAERRSPPIHTGKPFITLKTGASAALNVAQDSCASQTNYQLLAAPHA